MTSCAHCFTSHLTSSSSFTHPATTDTTSTSVFLRKATPPAAPPSYLQQQDETFQSKSGEVLSNTKGACLLTQILYQLSRGKDPSKSSKKNKDPKDGSASPSSRDNQSPNLTPTSSTSTLNDTRSKQVSSNSGGEHGVIGQPSSLSNVASQGSLPDRFGPLGGAQSPNGGSASSRLPPTVVISPTPGVRSLPPFLVFTGFLSQLTGIAYSTAWRSRNHAP